MQMVEVFEKKAVSEKVRREKEELFSAPLMIDTERLKFLLEVYDETSMDPHIMTRAKLFHKICSEKTIFIDGNPIVGTLTQYKYGAYPFPEEFCAWMERAEEFALPRGLVQITPEVREWINKAINLWKNSNLFTLSQRVIQQRLNIDIRTFGKCGVWLELSPVGARHMIVPDYSKVVNRGMKGLIAEIQEEEAKLILGEPGALDKWYFYQAARIVLEGTIILARRYASLAREMAKGEKNKQRKKELERIAETCEWVPANPARSFIEALQSFWFTQLDMWLEASAVLTSPPVTFTQCLYPFYKKDKEGGRVNDEEVIDLIQFWFLKINQLAPIIPPHGFRFNQSRLGQQLSLGGLTPDGKDATNELDWLVLEAQYRIRLPEPLVNLVYHDKLSENFLLKCVDLIRTGIGQPAFHNGRIGIERHLYHHKMPLEEARSFRIAGCVQSTIPGYTDGYWEMRLNVAKLIECTLEDGRDSLTGIQLGPQTGEAENFKSYDEFYRAFVKQLEHFVPLTHETSRIVWSMQRNFPSPLGSSLANDCIKLGKDISNGGARYSFGDGVCLVAVVDAANSLAAIKNVVFDEKKISMRQLKEALAADFKGYPEIERMCLGAPKYGNDDEYADSIAKGIYDICFDLHPKTDHLGRPVMPSSYSVAGHCAFGELTGALPSGKRARKPLADASVSAQAGTDKNGPTALAKSAAKIVDSVKYGSSHFNMRFHPAALKGLDGAKKLLSLIKTYFDLGGYHIQFNCVSGETLRDAQLHPENYRDLIVRVAGFSAYFTRLDKDVQDEIVNRTEHLLA